MENTFKIEKSGFAKSLEDCARKNRKPEKVTAYQELAYEIAKNPVLMKALSDLKDACDEYAANNPSGNNIACGHIAGITKQKQV